MEAVFLKIVNMSITASYLVLAVLLFRILLPKAPKSLRVILWGLVGLRLALPFSAESVWSLVPSAQTLPDDFLYAASPTLNSGIPAINNTLNPIISQSLAPDPVASANPTQILSFLFSQVWLLGMVLMFLYAIFSYILLRRKTGPSIPDGETVRISDRIDTPFILGILRPRIYLPAGLEGDTRSHVLAHEKAHLARRDHWWKPLGFLLLSIHWFNPVIWLAYGLLCRDIELACDERVIRELDTAQRKAYSTALLQCSIPRKAITACPLAFGEVGVKKRIRSVLNYKKPAFWLLIFAIAASVIIAACFLTDPATQTVGGLLGENSDDPESVTVTTPLESYTVSSSSGIRYILEVLDDVSISQDAVSQDRSEDRDDSYTLDIRYATAQLRLSFSEDMKYVWLDDGVKPSLTHQVLDAQLLRQLFSATLEAPAANRMATGTYVPAECMYISSLSSYYPGNVAEEYVYTVTQEGFFTNSKYPYCNTNVSAVDWGWKPVSQCREELEFFSHWLDLDATEHWNTTDSSLLLDSYLYQRLDDVTHLLSCDNEIYILHGSSARNVYENVWAIYRLIPQETVTVPEQPQENSEYVSGQQYQLQSSVTGEVYDSRNATDLLIRDAVMNQLGLTNTDTVFYAEAHTVESEAIGCGEAQTEDAPCGIREITFYAQVTQFTLDSDSILPSYTTEDQYIRAKLHVDEYTDGRLIPTDCEILEQGGLAKETDALTVTCHAQAMKYWALDTGWIISDLIGTIARSPAQASSAKAYLDAHPEEYRQLLALGEYTLLYCFDKFLSTSNMGIQGEVMAAACRDIGSIYGEGIDFDGQYSNADTWFQVFRDHALAKYETSGLYALQYSNPVSWLLLNRIGSLPQEIPVGQYTITVTPQGHYSNAVALSVEIACPRDVAIDRAVSAHLTYTRNGQTVTYDPSQAVWDVQEGNILQVELIFNLYSDAPTDSTFTLTLEGLPDQTEPLVYSYQADVAPADIYRYDDGSTRIQLTVSPLLLNAELSGTPYQTLGEVYQDIRIISYSHEDVFLSAGYGGSEGGSLIRLCSEFSEPIDIDWIESISIGNYILEKQ